MAWEKGTTTSYGLKNAEERGTLFLSAPESRSTKAWWSASINARRLLVVKVCKKRHVTNVRSSIREIDDRLSPPREMSLDQSIEYLNNDELLEITPENLRIRKRTSDTRTRGRQNKRTKERKPRSKAQELQVF